MSLISKGINYYQKYGLLSVIKKSFDKLLREANLLPARVCELFVSDHRVLNLREWCRGSNLFVVIPNIDWSVPLYQRPHQLASVLSKRENTKVIFISDQHRYDMFSFSKKINDNLILYSLRMTKRLDEISYDAKNIVVLMCWPRHINILNNFRYSKLIYEYMDELTLFYYYNEEMEQAHRQLLRQADLSTVTADKLYDKAKPFAYKLLLSENAGDYNFFHSSRVQPVCGLINEIKTEYETILGYYGSLASWFDYEIIKTMAELRSDWAFIIVGLDFDGTAGQLDLERHPNIIFVPAQPYKNLPSYLNGFDIALIPFVVNDITLSTSPVKLFEYMAAGKPVLSSDLPECRKYKSVHRYKSHDEFIREAEVLLSLRLDENYLELLNTEAIANTWDLRVENILTELG